MLLMNNTSKIVVASLVLIRLTRFSHVLISEMQDTTPPRIQICRGLLPISYACGSRGSGAWMKHGTPRWRGPPPVPVPTNFLTGPDSTQGYVYSPREEGGKGRYLSTPHILCRSCMSITPSPTTAIRWKLFCQASMR